MSGSSDEIPDECHMPEISGSMAAFLHIWYMAIVGLIGMLSICGTFRLCAVNVTVLILSIVGTVIVYSSGLIKYCDNDTSYTKNLLLEIFLPIIPSLLCLLHCCIHPRRRAEREIEDYIADETDIDSTDSSDMDRNSSDMDRNSSDMDRDRNIGETNTYASTVSLQNMGTVACVDSANI